MISYFFHICGSDSLCTWLNSVSWPFSKLFQWRFLWFRERKGQKKSKMWCWSVSLYLYPFYCYDENTSTWFAYIYIFPYTTCFILYAYCLRVFLLNLNMYYFSIFIPKYDIMHAIRFLVCSNNKLHCTMVGVNSFNMRNILWDVSLYVKFSFYFCAHVMMTTQWNHSALMSFCDISVNLEMNNKGRKRS